MNVTSPAPFVAFEGTEAVSRVRPLHEPCSSGRESAYFSLEKFEPAHVGCYEPEPVHGPNARRKAVGATHEPVERPTGLGCVSPLELSHPARASKSGRGLPQSK